MKINNHEYGFLYTVGAHVELQELQLSKPKNEADLIKLISIQAEILSRAYEEKKAFSDAKNKKKVLTRKEVMLLDYDLIWDLGKEINTAIIKGTKRTVEAISPKAQSKVQLP